MSKYYKENDTFSFETYVSVNFTYKSYPSRIEEGHGYHEFSEDEETDREIESVKITISSGDEIDITDRLTEEEKKKILNDL